MHLSYPQIAGVVAILMTVVSVILLRYNPLDKNGRSPMTPWKRVRVIVYIATIVLIAVAILWNLISIYFGEVSFS